MFIKLPGPSFYFNDGPAAFQFACSLSKADVSPGDTLPGLIVSLTHIYMTGLLVGIKLASPSGGRHVLFNDVDPVTRLDLHDLVAFRISWLDSDPDAHEAIAGSIVARFALQFVDGSGWKVENRTPV